MVKQVAEGSFHKPKQEVTDVSAMAKKGRNHLKVTCFSRQLRRSRIGKFKDFAY